MMIEHDDDDDDDDDDAIQLTATLLHALMHLNVLTSVDITRPW